MSYHTVTPRSCKDLMRKKHRDACTARIPVQIVFIFAKRLFSGPVSHTSETTANQWSLFSTEFGTCQKIDRLYRKQFQHNQPFQVQILFLISVRQRLRVLNAVPPSQCGCSCGAAPPEKDRSFRSREAPVRSPPGHSRVPA